MPGGRRVKLQAGALWGNGLDAAAGHGRSVLHGSSPDVSGYSLAPGIAWYARSFGLQTNAITAVSW